MYGMSERNPETRSLKEIQAGNIRILLTRVSKSRLASDLNIQNTQTLDQWMSRSQVPTKYHVTIEELLKKYGNQP